MRDKKWTINVFLHRQKEGKPPWVDKYSMEVDPDEYVLDIVERVWAFHDRSLCFRHACHHSVCGACGMRVNGVEKLTCITTIREVVKDGGTMKIEPLRYFPVVSDLVVDVADFFNRLEAANLPQVVPLTEAPPSSSKSIAVDKSNDPVLERMVDCFECGMCISACPVPATNKDYLGPAVLAAVQHRGLAKNPSLLALVDNQDGAWRCHSAHECTAVCPSFMEPAWRIMDLRKQILVKKVTNLFKV
jgi:succinate dehydrogenase/fumarate reductase iron-sulfur protein